MPDDLGVARCVLQLNTWMSVRNDSASIRFALQFVQIPTLTARLRAPKG